MAKPASPTFKRPASVLVVAGPSHEPIDAVRYIANRSSGRLGLHLAEAAAARGCSTTLLLGPAPIEASEKIARMVGTTNDPANAGTRAKPGQDSDSSVRLVRFRSSRDLELALQREATGVDVLIMAAAVADYRPAQPHAGKLPRTGQPLTLQLEPVPDLLAGVTPGLGARSIAIGFALEADAADHRRALAKMARKGCHAIVVNPLETMDSAGIDATILFADGREPARPGPLSKAHFAQRLIDIALDLWHQRQTQGPAS